jgi:AraC-like DNA-binding protein
MPTRTVLIVVFDGLHSGYGTTEAMRRAFHRTLGVSPAEYRRRF